ncbi:YciI family protein [Hyphobacterium sp.]|uniref:YciI family protein n=1 Tax=Hyphobacterium sp. TaxID=2004662 RepID=UPI003BA9B728
MQFLLLLHDDEQAWIDMSEAEQHAVIGEHMAYSEALTKAGAFVEGAPLDPSTTARIVSGDTVQDGPYADTKEQLGGYYRIEAASMDEAIDWARRCPVARTGKVEVRPVPDYG